MPANRPHHPARCLRLAATGSLILAGFVLGASPVLTLSAQAQSSGRAPVDILPQPKPAEAARPQTVRGAGGGQQPAAPPTISTAARVQDDSVPLLESSPMVQEIPTDHFQIAPTWSTAQAGQLLGYIENIGNEGLFPGDYQPEALRKAIAGGPGLALNETATKLYIWVAQDLRDGRTEMESRKQWFVRDPDADRLPIKPLLEGALAGGGIVASLDSLEPVHPDFAVLRQMLLETPESDKATRARIRANMDRWRWLGRDLGRNYLLTNVPEFQLRLVVNNKVHTSFRTIVGKPGRTATPQLSEMVEGVIFNPTWTVPQSIVVGEGLGARVMGNPAYARSKGYKAYKTDAGMTVVVQQPGPGNSLGLMKLDMPNPHAIFLHDTPAKSLFAQDSRALSHGCIRTEGAMKLAMILAKGLGGLSSEEAVEIADSRKYTRVPLTKELPVYITYFTMARDIDGEMRSFDDLYGRDAPVLASFAAPRVAKTGQRVTDEPVVAIEAPGA